MECWPILCLLLIMLGIQIAGFLVGKGNKDMFKKGSF